MLNNQSNIYIKKNFYLNKKLNILTNSILILWKDFYLNTE